MKTGTSTLTTHATPLNSPQNQVEYLEPNEKQSKKMNEKKIKTRTSSLTKEKTLKPRPNYRAFKTVKVYIMLAA